MSKTKPSRWVSVVIAIVLSGCAAYAPPIQEMSDARQSARAAVDAGAGRYFPTLIEHVNAEIFEAETRLAASDYQGAAEHALAAKTEAVRVRGLALTLVSALEVVAQAEQYSPRSKGARVLAQQALDAAARGDDGNAMRLVTEAQQEAGKVLDKHDLERAEALVIDLESDPIRLSGVALREALEAAKVAIQHREGQRAYSLLAPFAAH